MNKRSLRRRPTTEPPAPITVDVSATSRDSAFGGSGRLAPALVASASPRRCRRLLDEPKSGSFLPRSPLSPDRPIAPFRSAFAPLAGFCAASPALSTSASSSSCRRPRLSSAPPLPAPVVEPPPPAPVVEPPPPVPVVVAAPPVPVELPPPAPVAELPLLRCPSRRARRLARRSFGGSANCPSADLDPSLRPRRSAPRLSRSFRAAADRPRRRRWAARLEHGDPSSEPITGSGMRRRCRSSSLAPCTIPFLYGAPGTGSPICFMRSAGARGPGNTVLLSTSGRSSRRQRGVGKRIEEIESKRRRQGVARRRHPFDGDLDANKDALAKLFKTFLDRRQQVVIRPLPAARAGRAGVVLAFLEGWLSI